MNRGSLVTRQRWYVYSQKEVHLYGGSRLGIDETERPLVRVQVSEVWNPFNGTWCDPVAVQGQAREVWVNGAWVGENTPFPAPNLERFTDSTGKKRYELSNHLGNVLAVVSDRKLPQYQGNVGVIAYYEADQLSLKLYDPFGTIAQEWRITGTYRYSFNGKESDSEWDGGGAMFDYGFRIYDPRLGRFLSVDPLTDSYPWYTPYQFAGNTPIMAIDLDGLEPHKVTGVDGKETTINGPFANPTENENGGINHPAQTAYIEREAQARGISGDEVYNECFIKTYELKPVAIEANGSSNGIPTIPISPATIGEGNEEAPGHNQFLALFFNEAKAQRGVMRNYRNVWRSLPRLNFPPAGNILPRNWRTQFPNPKARGKALEGPIAQFRGLTRLQTPNFPVIDCYEQLTQHATSIKTLDISASSYQNMGSLLWRLNQYSNKLSGFTGNLNWGQDQVGAVTSRELIVGINGSHFSQMSRQQRASLILT